MRNSGICPNEDFESVCCIATKEKDKTRRGLEKRKQICSVLVQAKKEENTADAFVIDA